jgi:fructokinase
MIVVTGEALIDRIVQPDGSPVDHPGGGPFNTARTIARLGVPVAFLGALSTDPSGTILRDALALDGVDLSLAVATDAPTTVAIARIDPHGTATYRFETDGTSATQLPVDAVRAALATRPAAFHLGTLGLVLEPLATALADALEDVPPGTFVLLDPNCRAPAIADRGAYLARLLRVFRRVDAVKASRDDLDFLWPGMPVAVAAHRILTAGPAAVLVTDGERPVSGFTTGWAFELDVPYGPVVDTVGAGDAFGGAFLARWIERGFGRTELAVQSAVRDAVELAIRAASLTCGRSGADPPGRHELAWPVS